MITVCFFVTVIVLPSNNRVRFTVPSALVNCIDVVCYGTGTLRRYKKEIGTLYQVKWRISFIYTCVIQLTFCNTSVCVLSFLFLEQQLMNFCRTISIRCIMHAIV